MVQSIQVLHLKERLLLRWCRRFYGSWFMTGYLNTQDLQQALYWGIATGSASAFSENLATKDEVLALLNTIR